MSTNFNALNSRPATWPTIGRTGYVDANRTGNFDSGWGVPQLWMGMTMEKFWETSILAKLFNMDVLEPLTKFGGEAIIRKRPKIYINPYLVNETQTPETVNVETISIPVKYAYSAYVAVDSIDLQQMDIDTLDILAEDMNKEHMENENTVVLSGLVTDITAGAQPFPAVASTDPTYPALYEAWRRSSTVVDYTSTGIISGVRMDTAVSTSQINPVYIVKAIADLRTQLNKKSVPREGRFLFVPPEVEEVLMLSDQVVYNISGVPNKPIVTGEFGMNVCGFDIIASPFVSITHVTGTPSYDVANCIAGIKKGYAFVRQILEADIGFKMERIFGKGVRQLNVFGYGLANPAGCALLKLRIN